MGLDMTPLSVLLDHELQKTTGFILKISPLGFLVELDKIVFKVGSFMNATFELESGRPIVERVRSIKHYDNFYRQKPKKKLAEGEVPPAPKKLVEFHFEKPLEATKTQIVKFLMSQAQALPEIRVKK
jgi:hypothetical protein